MPQAPAPAAGQRPAEEMLQAYKGLLPAEVNHVASVLLNVHVGACECLTRLTTLTHSASAKVATDKCSNTMCIWQASSLTMLDACAGLSSAA